MTLFSAKKIYNNETHNKLLEYDTIDIINCSLEKTSSNLELNQYQTIPNNTYYCKCCYKNDKNDVWNYYLVNIINPDSAITGFFIKIKMNPFICSHKIDDNGIPICNYYLKFNDRNISLKEMV